MKSRLYFYLIAIQILYASDFRVLTYNIHALFPIIAGDDPKSRIIEILENSKDYDFILIQENWIFKNEYLLGQLPDYNWLVSHKSKFLWPLSSLINSNGSGLSIAISEHHDIIGINEERFRKCSGWLSKGNDCLSTKGFQHIQIRVDNQRLDIYNTHLDSGNRKSDYSARETQIYHLLDYIKENSAGYPVILSGDLNINLLDDKEMYLINALRDDLNLDMVDWVAKDSNYVEVLDYILYRGVNLVDGAFGVSRRLVALSDHPPIEADFKLRK